jgi:hypothetical protein
MLESGGVMVQLTPTMVVRGPDGGPAVPLAITPTDFHTVAQRFIDSQDDLERIRQDLRNGLNAASGAAGACDGAHQYQDGWAAAMDNIINGGFHTAFDLLGAIGKGIDVSALNHWTADQDSVPGQTSNPPPWSPVAPESSTEPPRRAAKQQARFTTSPPTCTPDCKD